MTTLDRASSGNPALPAAAAAPVAPSGTASLGRRLCIAVILLAAQTPLWIKLAAALWQRPQYQFFPLLLAGAGLLAWERWRDLPRSDTPPRAGAPVVSGALAFCALVALIAGGLFLVRSMALVSTLLLLSAIAWHLGGKRLLRAMTPPLILLAVLIPPPGHLDDALTLYLQHLAVNGSSRLLDALRIVHVQSGNVLEIPGRQLLIEQACSGINSLVSICAFALLLGFYRGRRSGHIVLLLAGAFAFVIGANVLRITIEAWLKISKGIDVLEGTRHEALGMLLFLICAGLVVSFDELLTLTLRRPASPPTRRAVEEQPAAVAATRTSKPVIVEWIAAGCFALAGLFVWTQVSSAWPTPSIRDDAAFHLPTEMAGWRQLEGEGKESSAATIERPQVLAARSSIWRFRRDEDGLLVSVALDYPFFGYHDLASCYVLAGWNVDQRIAGGAASTSQPAVSLAFAKIHMTKSSLQQGELLFGLLREDSQWMPAAPPTDPAEQMAGPRQWLAFVRRDATGQPTYQMQVFVQTYSALSPTQQDAIEQLYRQVSQTLARQTLDQLGSNR